MQQTNEQLQKIACQQSLLCFQVVMLLTLVVHHFSLLSSKYHSFIYMSSLLLDFISSRSVPCHQLFPLKSAACGETCMA